MIWAYTAAAVALIAYELLRKRELCVDWLTFFNLLAATYYLAVPLMHLYAPYRLQWRALSAFPQASSSPLTFLAVVLAHGAVIAGFGMARVRNSARFEILTRRITDRFMFGYGVTSILIFGLTSLALAVSSGGVVKLLLLASEARAGRASLGPLEYAQYLFDTAPYLLLFILAAGPNSQLSRLLRAPVQLLVFGIVLYLALMTAGRAKLLLPLVFAYLLWLNEPGTGRRWLAPAVTGVMVLVMITVIAYGKAAYWELSSLSEGVGFWVQRIIQRQDRLLGDASPLTAIGALLSFFDHHLVSLYVAIDRPIAYEAPRWFLDWPRAIVSYLPGLEQPEFLVSSTPAGLGKAVFQQAGLLYVGYVPPGWVAMNYINLMWAGLVIPPFLIGYIGGFLHKMILGSLHRARWLLGAYIAFGWLWIMLGLGADPFMAWPVLAFFTLTLLPLLIEVRICRVA